LKRIDRTTTLEDLASNPHGYGLPTLEEYAKIREQVWGRDDDAMASISDGPQKFRQDLHKIYYELNGKRLSGENEVERALSDHGYTLADIDLENRGSLLKKKIEMIPLGGGKFDLVVNFIP
jgi:hypothetical protein